MRIDPQVKAQMLIRRPVTEVFEAFVDPAITKKFWFTKSSGRLEPEKQMTWSWEMYGLAAEVYVKAVEPNTRILIEWDEPPTKVEWEFSPRGDDATLVSITNAGFAGSDEERVAQAMDSTGGFYQVLAGAKAYLEHGIELNLISDHHPDAHAG